MQKANVFCRMPYPHCNATINATCLDIPLRRENYHGAAISVVYGYQRTIDGITLPTSSLDCGEFGDSCNPVTKKTRRGSFGNRRPPASPRQWPELGPSFAKTNGPSFQGAYCTERRNVKSVVPRFLGCAHILVVAGSRRSFLSTHFNMRGRIKL